MTSQAMKNRWMLEYVIFIANCILAKKNKASSKNKSVTDKLIKFSKDYLDDIV
jgi:uncharacterized protein YbcC (UPF0753/DUF2309 family)